MHLLFKTAATVTILSLGLAMPASAKPALDAAPTTADLAQSEFLIASPFRKEISPAHQKRLLMTEMLMRQMELVDTAQEAMDTSDDPEVKQMAQDILNSNSSSLSVMMQKWMSTVDNQTGGEKAQK